MADPLLEAFHPERSTAYDWGFLPCLGRDDVAPIPPKIPHIVHYTLAVW